MNRFSLFALAAGVIVVDQSTKFFARLYAPDGPLLNLAWNTGAAFGLFQNSSLILGVLGVVVAGVVAYWLWSGKIAQDEGLWFALFLGGVLGNALDRLVFGIVTDFIDLGFWPVFNIADMAAVIGVAGIIYIEIRNTLKRNN